MISDEALAFGMAAIGNAYNISIDGKTEVYAAQLSDLMDDNEWRMVVSSVLAQEERWPPPAVFRRHLDELREQNWEEREADDRKRMLDDEAAWHKRLDEGPA
jgi:hypothetical protein